MLKPIFRDRDELPAGSDLTQAINEALFQSEYLVVICSPAAAGPRWTNLEISEFRKTHDDSRILCLIVGGEPFAPSIPGREAEECIPPALGYSDRFGDDIDRSTIEPIAADLRPGDFFIQLGSPGHAVLVLDLAVDARGRRVALLGQGYMPAQDFHLLRAGDGSAWFRLRGGVPLRTPLWPKPFLWRQLRRFGR